MASRLLAVLALAAVSASDLLAQVPTERRAAVLEAISRCVRDELAASDLPGMSVAIADRNGIVWAGGFGTVGPGDTPATADTVYRAASISKLVTATTVMRLVEAGELDLDRDLRAYLPDFRPPNVADDRPITLRHLLSHHAGILREPPQGHYFLPGDSLPELVASMAEEPLVYAPGEVFKYSNAGPSIAGHVVERITDTPFPEHVRRHVLEPLGMTSSTFDADSEIAARCAKGTMWTLDDREFPAPTFTLGMLPAANLYTTLPDLMRFAQSWFLGADDGGPERTRVVSEPTLRAMFEPPFAARFVGLGFFLSDLDGARCVGHGGAIYGFSTEVAALPDEGLAAAAATTVDFTNGAVRRVVDHALRVLRAAQQGGDLPVLVQPKPLGTATARAWEGRYGDATFWVDLVDRDGELLEVPSHGTPTIYRAFDGSSELVSAGRFSDRIGQHTIRRADAGGIVRDGRALPRVPDRAPPPCPDEWRPLLGEYGWDHDVLYVLEDHGRLCVLIEWFARYPLDVVDAESRVFRFPMRSGMYHGETLRFEHDADGNVLGVTVGGRSGVFFPRRAVGTAAGETFRIEPRFPIERLRAMAREARMPREPRDEMRAPDLVDLAEHVEGLRFDLRYGTENNFMGTRFYEVPRALLQRPAAEALARVRAELAEHGYGLLVHDAYRPWSVTRMFWDATPDEMRTFVADPANGSRHNRGCAIDLTLVPLGSDEPVEMVSGYDEFTPRAYPWYPGGTDRARWHRALLRRAMERHGFTVYEWEWWHFDFADWRHYPILDEPLR